MPQKRREAQKQKVIDDLKDRFQHFHLTGRWTQPRHGSSTSIHDEINKRRLLH